MTSFRSMALVGLAAASFATAADSRAAGPDRHVVVISIDGLPGYLLDDPHASLPAIRGLRDDGAFAAEGMRVSNPSVTWPNHTTMMTGVHPEKHGVLFNGLLERHGVGQPVRVVPKKDQKDLVRVPMLFDHLKAAGLESAAINWPCTRGSTSIEANFPDVPDQLSAASDVVKSTLEKLGRHARFLDGGPVVRDEIWTDVACDVIRERRPSLVAVHLLNLDSTHHKYGPKTNPGYTSAGLQDANISRILAAIKEAGIREKTTVFVVADHGFITVKKTLNPNSLLRKEGLLTVDGNEVRSARVQVVPEGGIGMVYCNDPATADKDRETARSLFQGAEGVACVLSAEDFPRYHLPLPKADTRMADLVLVAKDGYSVTAKATEDAFVTPAREPFGAHGYVSTDPQMNAIFVASGYGIRTGVKVKDVENTDLAPTIARILGVKLEGAGGRVLTEILDGHE
ncbi:alkaline phosphatase family protein [Aquisphaera insulae]|uniref:alkaline phosphatase family protein n=1 Tax=Aquisphaera insulae TaxID=2712864 RepID=UPI00202E5DE3|nr:alkaline phosphatase family protein [Aquisphaera insulae]